MSCPLQARGPLDMSGQLREALARTTSKRGWAFWMIVVLAFLLLPVPIAVPLIASRLLRYQRQPAKPLHSMLDGSLEPDGASQATLVRAESPERCVDAATIPGLAP